MFADDLIIMTQFVIVFSPVDRLGGKDHISWRAETEFKTKLLKESESGRRMSMIIKQKCTRNGDSCDTTQGAAKFLHKNIK